MQANESPRQIGPYRVISMLGQGAMGCVYRATLPLMGDQEYAVKLLWERCRPSEVSAFLGECSKVKRLGVHPQIILSHFAGRDRRLGRYYVVMELVNGPSAAQALAEAPGRQLPVEQALHIALHAAQGLEHAHQRGVLHLDVKPSNILIQAEEGIAKITDFGSAVVVGEATASSLSPEGATPAYRAWEQTPAGRRAGLRPDERTDVYGLAATLYELLTGHLPASAGANYIPATCWRADLPQSLVALLEQALSHDPEQRPTTMAAFRRTLEAALTPARAATTLPLPKAGDLVGRETLLRDLKQQLLGGGSLALSALNGLPGVGKTALVLAIAHDREVQAHFADGILWAGLGRQPDVAALLGAWCAALGIPTAQPAGLNNSEAQTHAIHQAIGNRRMLLVIDDAWQVEMALLFKLGGPHCAYLVTTRLPEVALRFADAGATVVRVRELSEADGLTLLVRLAPEVVEREPEEARALVRMVDGLPLALSLMGHFLRVQTYIGQPRRLRAALELLHQGKERLRLAQPLSQPAGNTPVPSPSLMASINASYQALSRRARSMLLALSVFPAKPNDCSEEAALAVSAASTRALDVLLDSGLLESSGPGRYTLHQTIADFARWKRLSAKPAQRMVGFFASYAEAHQRDADALGRESSNMLTALQVAADQGMPTALVRLTNALVPFWETRGDYAVAEAQLRQAQEAARSLDDTAALLNTLAHYGQIMEKRGEYAPAQTLLQEALALARQIGQRDQISHLLASLATVAFKLGNHPRAEEHYQEGLKLARAIGNRDRISALLQGLGALEMQRGNYAQAEAWWRESLDLARQVGQRERTCVLLSSLGGLLFLQERNEEAEQHLQAALALARALGHRERISSILSNLGGLAANGKHYTQAEVHLREGLAIAREIGHRERICALLTNLGSVALYQGEVAQAEACVVEGLALAREMHYPWYISSFLCNQGELYLKQIRWDDAEVAFRQSLSIAKEVKSQELIATCFYGLAQVEAAQGSLAEARRLGREGLVLFESIGYYMAAEVREWLAALPLAQVS